MNFTKVFSLFALLTLAVLSVSAVSAATIFSDNFDSTSTFSTGWNANSWIINTTAGSNHAYSSDVANTLLERSISTSGMQNIVLSYQRMLGDSGTGSGGTWEGSDNFTIYYSLDNGVTFTILDSVPGSSGIDETTYTSKTHTIANANNNINFKIKIECTTSAQTEFCRVDDFLLTGDAISTSPLTITPQGTQPFQVGQNATLSITNNGASSLSGTISETGSTLFGVTFSPNTFNLAGGASSSFNAILSNLQNLKFGTNTVHVQATSTSGIQGTASFDVRKTFCSAVPLISNLTIKSIDISNDGEGDENEWELLDEMDIEVEVENNNQDDDIDVIVEIGLFDATTGNNFGDELDFTSDSDSDNEEIEININEDDSETVNFKFKVPADFDTGNYRLAFKVYDDDLGESKSCRDLSSDLDEGFFESVDVKEASDEGRFVIVDEFNIESQVVCGTTLTGQFTIFNVGEEDQDRVNVIIKNNELNINEEVEFANDLDKGDEETLSFSVKVPSTASNGIKQLEFITEYDYKNGVYREDSEESFVFPVEVIGCSQNLGGSGSSLSGTTIEAELSSDAVAGEELVVVSTITNTGSESKSYSISARGYSDWAELTDISDGSFSLDAGESEEVTFTFTVMDDASGSNAFDIQVTSDGKVQVQEVEVELADSEDGFSFDLKGNSTLWIIGLINVVLIVLIIVVAIRLSNK